MPGVLWALLFGNFVIGSGVMVALTILLFIIYKVMLSSGVSTLRELTGAN